MAFPQKNQPIVATAGMIDKLAMIKLAVARAQEEQFEKQSHAQQEETDQGPIPEAPEHWQNWLALLYQEYTKHPYAAHHIGFWRWVWSIELGQYQRPFIAIWPRGGAKSTSVELGVAAMAARGKRRYALYISASQPRADDHVANISAMLGTSGFERYYPEAANRLVSKYGISQGWGRRRLRTRSGFTVDAIGLDVASRGVKIEDMRPDLIILDDIDELFDSTEGIKKKMDTLTRSLLPTGSEDCIVLVAQNLIHQDSIVSRLADGRADFLSDRFLSGPFPALYAPVYEEVKGKTTIISGNPIWEGQNLEICNRYVDRFGISSFRTECQQETELVELSMFGRVAFQHVEMAKLPILDRIETWLDPAVSDTDQSDSNGIQIDGVLGGVLYRLWSWEQRSSPEQTLRMAIIKSLEWGSNSIGIETDQGGDVWRPAYNGVWDDLVKDPECPWITERTPKPILKTEKVARLTDESGKGQGPGFASKASRGQQMLTDYELAKIIHVINPEGTHETLEKALLRFLVRKPYDLVDAAYWGWKSLARPRGGVW